MIRHQPDGKVHEWTRADRLRVARESVADSQADFAKMTAISKNTISRYESGSKTKELYVRQWAAATGFSFQWLMWGHARAPAARMTVSRRRLQMVGHAGFHPQPLTRIQPARTTP